MYVFPFLVHASSILTKQDFFKIQTIDKKKNPIRSQKKKESIVLALSGNKLALVNKKNGKKKVRIIIKFLTGFKNIR